jgi:hypothetical protein
MCTNVIKGSLLGCEVNFLSYKLIVSEEPNLSIFRTEIFYPENKGSLFLEKDGAFYQATRSHAPQITFQSHPPQNIPPTTTFKNYEQEILKISVKTRNKLNSRIHDDFSLQEYKDRM